MNLMNKMTQHGFGDIKICNHAVSHGANGHNIARRPAQHVLGFLSHSQHPVFMAVIRTNRDNRWFPQHNALALHIDQRIGRPKINGQIAGKNPQDGIQKKIHHSSFQI